MLSTRPRRPPPNPDGVTLSLGWKLLAAFAILLAIAGLGATAAVGIDAPFSWSASGEIAAEYAHAGRALARADAAPRLRREPGLPSGEVTTDARDRIPSLMVRLVAGSHRWLGERPIATRLPALFASIVVALAFGRLVWRAQSPPLAVAAVVGLLVWPRFGAAATLPDEELIALAAALLAGTAYLAYRRTGGTFSALATVFWLVVSGACGVVGLGMGAALALGSALEGTVGAAAREASDGQAGPSPLLGVMRRRAGRELLVFAAVLAGALLLEAAVLLSIKVAGPVSLRAARMPWLTEPTPAPALTAGWPSPQGPLLAAWALLLLGRVVTRRARPRDVVSLGVLAAAALAGSGLGALWGALPSLGTTRLVAATLAFVDLSTFVGRLVAFGRGRIAGAVTLVLVVAGVATVARELRPVWLGERLPLAAVSDPAAGARLARAESDRWLIRHLRDATASAEPILFGETCAVPPSFVHELERDLQAAPPLSRMSSAALARDSGLVLLCEGPRPEDAAAWSTLLRAHPVDWLSDRSQWLVDLRRSEPGVQVLRQDFAPRPQPAYGRFVLSLATRLRVAPDPWRAAELDAAYGVAPIGPRFPPVSLAEATTRARLLMLHNLYVRVRDPLAAQARAHLLEGYAAPTAFVDPAPFGLPVGLRHKDGRLAIVWECPATPPRAPDFSLRVVGRPIGRPRRGFVLDLPAPNVCRDAESGELTDDAAAVPLPDRGAWVVGLEVTRPRGKLRRSTGHLVELTVDAAAP